MSLSFLVLSMLAVLLPASLGAQSQNEVITTVLYDGTDTSDGRFGDTGGTADPTGTVPEPHTPGLDDGPNNLVVRTYDQFAIRVDWNVNEAAATAVTLTTVLPPEAEWTTDNTGEYAGCLTTTFPDPQTAVCVIDAADQPEGSNGAIRMTAVLNSALDNTTFDVTSTLTTGEDAAGVSDGLDQELTVSEAALVDFRKHTPLLSDLVTEGSGEPGYVLLFPITATDGSQGPNPTIGSGPVNDAVPVNFFDHMWSLTPSAALASPAAMAAAGFAGTNCGDYAQAGPFVSGNGTWTCGSPTVGAGGYRVVPINVSGFVSNPAPATLADASANAISNPQFTSGQIAIFLPESEVEDAIADESNGDSTISAIFYNSITSADDSFVISDPDDVVPEPQAGGTSGPSQPGPSANNIAEVPFGDAPVTDTTPGFTYGQDIRWMPGPLQLQNNVGLSEGTGFVGFDIDSAGILPGQNLRSHHIGGTDFIGQVSRGQTLTLEAMTELTGGGLPDGYETGIHQCIALDTAHYNLTDLPAAIPFRENNNDAGILSMSTVAPTDGIAYVSQGSFGNIARRTQSGVRAESAYASGGDAEPWAYIVEVTDAALPTVGTGQTGIDEDRLTCDAVNAGGEGWVDASGDLSAFDANADGLYEGITRVRVRSLEAGTVLRSQDRRVWGWNIYLNAQVLQDFGVNSDDQELFAFTSSNLTQGAGWDGVAAEPNYRCRPHTVADWNTIDRDQSSVIAVSGWCSNEFIDDGADSFDTGDLVDFDTASTGTLVQGQVAHSSGTVVSIVGAKPVISKINNDGTDDIADNGDTVTFTISPRIVGADVEALTNVVVTDVLPANYEFVSMTQPGTPGSSCTESAGTIMCQYSEPDPAVDSGALPTALAGGWPTAADGDPSFEVTVLVTGALASPTSATVLTNTAEITSDALAPWDPVGSVFIGPIEDVPQSDADSANSFMPLPADEGAIVKAVETLLGPCDAAPSTAPAVDLAVWAERCSMIQDGDDMSFVLSLENEGNTAFTNIEIIDVFPWNGDGPGSEPPSETATDVAIPFGSEPFTVGDGRTPPSAFGGTVGFVSMTDIDTPAPSTTYVTGDAPGTVSRDALASFTNAGNTWCDGVGGAVVNGGSGACPAAATDVTATYTHIAGDLNPQETLELQLTLSSEGSICEDVWTNTFGSRVDQIFLPIRSNDVSVVVMECFEAGIDIEKDTNGVQSDVAPGEEIVIGAPVTWTYVVTNTGTTALADATVTDVPAPAGGIACDIAGDGSFSGSNVIPFMLPGDAVTCQSTGIATGGPFTNNASVAGDPIVPDFSELDPDLYPDVDPSDPSTWPTDPALFQTPPGPDGLLLGPVDDADPSNYTGVVPEPGIDIEKDTNGVQSDEGPGEEIAFGDAVTWTYVVTNTGGTALANATVTDNTGVAVDCGDGTNVIAFLAVGASVTCTAEGTAQVGPYENVGDVTGDPITPDFATCGCDPEDPSTWPANASGYVAAVGDDGLPLGPVADADASHFTGTAAFDLALEKTIADGQDVSNLQIGDDVTYTIEVFNQGTVDASDLSLIDYTPAAMEVNDPDWVVGSDGNATIDLVGVTLAPGESTTVDITMTILEAGDIDNTAEITNSTAVDANGAPIVGADGEPLADVDSVADAADTDVLSDGVLNNDGDDEDDHDIASITVAAAVPPVLAFTGFTGMQLLIAALMAIGAGMGLTLFTRNTLVARKED